MECDDFVSQNVIPGSDAGRNLDSPAVVRSNQLIGCPIARYGCIIDQATLIDFEKLQGGLVNLLAIATTLSKVVDDWAVVR